MKSYLYPNQKCNLFISIGTSGLVYPSASIPSIAKKAGAFCIEINPEETELSYLYDHTFRQRATSGLKSLFSVLQPQPGDPKVD